jgi:ribosomal protein S18 acetylase RimI-like enzyme
MIEGLVEEETKFGTASNPIEPKSNANCLTLERVDALATKIDKELPSWNQNVWELPNGYQFTDENSNVINATKIVLEKKPDDKLKLESTKKVREYWSEYARIYIEIYDDEPNECVLTHLYTLEGHRQKGYGRQALIEAESIAKELGCHTTYLKVETDSWMHQWYLRMGYKWYKNVNNEYTWLTKNLTGVERKKEYPKTYEECCRIVNANPCIRLVYNLSDGQKYSYDEDNLRLYESIRKLLICRDAYWKIAGEEMGLGKPWEPDWNDGELKWCMSYSGNYIEFDQYKSKHHTLAFPTEEMRDAFYENFDPDIEICKEFL